MGMAEECYKRGVFFGYFRYCALRWRYVLHGASSSFGVRPEFWLVKQESRGPVPRENKVSYKTLKGWNPKNKVTKESLQEEISEKENEIKLLKQEIKNLEEKEMFAKAASEMKNLKDRFVELEEGSNEKRNSQEPFVTENSD